MAAPDPDSILAEAYPRSTIVHRSVHHWEQNPDSILAIRHYSAISPHSIPSQLRANCRHLIRQWAEVPSSLETNASLFKDKHLSFPHITIYFLQVKAKNTVRL